MTLTNEKVKFGTGTLSIVFPSIFPSFPSRYSSRMLSRVAQASRLGLMAARLSRPVTSRTRPEAAAVVSPWIRAYSKKNRPSPSGSQKPSQPKDTSDSSYIKAEAEAAQDAASKSEESAGGVKDSSEPQIPFDKLPDLTQGIPSTLEYEMAGEKAKSQAKSELEQALQEVEQQEESEGGRGGGRERTEYVSTTERNRKWWTRFMLISTAAGGTLGLLYMGRDWDDVIEAERHSDIPNGFSPALWWKRSKARMTDSVTYYQEPSFDKLLPDPDPSFERPYTLCLSLDDLLVHSEWSREYGWRVAKRPGVDYFIRYLSQYYELVLFTTVPFATGEPLVRKLDPFRFIMWPLYREATKYENGEVVKVRPDSSEKLHFLTY